MLSVKTKRPPTIANQPLPKKPGFRGAWSLEESILFLEMHEKCCNHWIQIAGTIVTKTQNDIKNHFYILLKKYIQNIKVDCFTFEGHLDLIQCHYVVSYIVGFFRHKQNTHKKDYLRTLVVLEKITESMSVPYLKKLESQYPLLKVMGWKKYYEETKTYSPICLTGYSFPNRVLPPIDGISTPMAISQEDKETMKKFWGVN